jgi:hypothetical protein
MSRLHLKLERLEKYLDMKSLAIKDLKALPHGEWDAYYASGMANVIFGAREIIND